MVKSRYMISIPENVIPGNDMVEIDEIISIP